MQTCDWWRALRNGGAAVAVASEGAQRKDHQRDSQERLLSQVAEGKAEPAGP